MRPAPIPDDAAARFASVRPARRIVVGPPGNDLDSPIPPVEAMVEQLDSGHAISMRCVLEEGDLEKLADGNAVWITMLGQVVPFAVNVGP